MGSLIRWDTMDDHFDNLVRTFLRPVAAANGASVVPIRMDVSENAKGYLVNAEMPGIRKEDIKVEIDGNQVSISAETKGEKEVKNGDRVLRSERYYGKVARNFAVSDEIDEATAEAKYENGVLTLTLPKKATAKIRQLAVA